MIMFSIIVNLSSLPLFVFLYVFSLSSSRLCFASRVAVIRGSVVLQDGSPLVGVNITFPQHPEYGYTISRQDGRYRNTRTKHTSAYLSLASSFSNLIPFYFHSTLVLIWWHWARCLWPWCFSAHPSCHKHAPSGHLTTISWFWIRWPCPGRKGNLLNVTSGVFWVLTRWSCPTRFPDSWERVQRKVQLYLSSRYKTTQKTCMKCNNTLLSVCRSVRMKQSSQLSNKPTWSRKILQI